VSPLANRWLTLQAGRTLVERRGGHPQHLLQDAPPDLSERHNRKAAIATLDSSFDVYRCYRQQPFERVMEI